MGILRCLAASIMLAFVASMPANAQEGRWVDENPRWITHPDGGDFDAFWPAAAQRQRVTGFVALECQIAIDTTANCTVTSETPQGWGFAEAALAISHSFRIRPAYRNGEPIATGRFRVRLPFRLEEVPTYGEYQNLVDQLPQIDMIDIPDWEEAPNFATTMQMRPAAGRGKALLSCTIKSDRGITCAAVSEFPVDEGFGAAAVDLASLFRVAAHDTNFIDQHRQRPFLLPISFGDDPLNSPIDVSRDDLPANATPFLTPELTARFYPSAAAPTNPRGEVILRCTADGQVACSVYYENPRNLAFGDAAQRMVSSLPSETTDFLSGVFGSPFYLPFIFELASSVEE